ncbi:MATE family efflux transporter [Aliiglaciecola sp. LCG003]|uniref:MATE family efflux transporter n=1 Tax=Aliiglaciecola sp. LCG003 TaxID=3053655 RepID=UPI0025724A21|nr:MATE family efflux transporter [Aliiglaciecola sp. LCG003]WJG11097.1 MATE family efflux transporter [Aliiglaciecola sp. LCG003]
MKTFKQELLNLSKLTWPLLVAQVTQTLMGVADTIMAGRFSAIDMAAVAIGFSITIPILCFVQGLAMALPPIISKLHGAGENHFTSDATQQTFYLVLPICLLISLASVFVPYWFSLIDMETELRRVTVEYVQYILYSAPAFGVYQVLRNYCEGLSNTKPTMIIMAIGLLVNIPANYVLIYGEFGLPAMGGAGCGVATALVYVAMLVSTVTYIALSKRMKDNHLFSELYAPQLSKIISTFNLGLPIALTILFEVTLFGVVALLLSPLGPLTLASHQIALNFSSLMFMFPLSIGMATTIRVGFFIGKKDYAAAKLASKTAIILGLVIATISATTTILAREQISLLYSNNPEVVNLAMSLMMLAAMFQISDSIQAISAGALRGYKDTGAMFIITFIAYWLIGLPVGVLLALTDVIVPAIGARGFWMGFIFGLTSAAVMLGIRLRITQKRLECLSVQLS